MNKKTGLMVAALLVAAVITLTVLFIPGSDDAMSAEEVRTLLEDRYTGDVHELSYENGVFTAVFHAPFGQYAIELMAGDGRITAFEKISSETEFQDWEDSEPDGGVIGIEEVRGIVDSTLAGEASISEMQLVETGGSPYYEVNVAYEGGTGILEIDAQSGEILLYTMEDDAPAEPISEQQAVEIALREHSGEVDDIDLEERNGRLVYEIEIENDSTGVDADIVIDAYTGEVLSVEYDD